MRPEPMRIVLPALVGLVFCTPASAQYAEIGVTGGYGSFRDGGLASFGGSAEGAVYEYTDGVRIGARMSFDFRDFFAHEVAYVYQHAQFRVTQNLDDGATQTVSDT